MVLSPVSDWNVPDSNARTGLGETQCIEITGEHARAFAQAQFSGDVRALQPLHWQWNAWLDHKGAVRALMHLGDLGDGRLLALLRGGDAESICAGLRKYVLRSRVRIEPLRDRFLATGIPLSLHELRIEGDATGFGGGDRSVWLESVRRSNDAQAEHNFRLAEIRAGWPRLPPDHDAEFFPPALGLEHLNAVSFDKGCYPGQEIAARLHYRGGHKRRMAHVQGVIPLRSGESLPDGRGRGVVLDAVQADGGWQALAVLDEINPSRSSNLQGELQVIRRFEA